jgi:tetratricopeptide (TPR) repeat protein
MHEMVARAINDPALMSAGLALSEGRFEQAEPILRARLRENPLDVVAIRMMAELATRLGRMADAERLLRRALDLAPFYSAARELLARNLQRSNRPEEALVEVAHLVAQEPDQPTYLMLRASLLVKVGHQEGARNDYEAVLAKHPRHAKTWMSLGHVLKTLGQQGEGIAAYRRAIDEEPTLGEAWWSLANLKTVAFSADDVAQMERALSACQSDEDRLHLHFALGKAREDAREYEKACAHWDSGNSIRHKLLPYDAEETHQACQSSMRFYTAERLAGRNTCRKPDPIFIVGLPRSGSTLIEQILASHSLVEGTMELPDLMAIESRLAAQAAAAGKPWPAALADLNDEALRLLGEEYLERTRIQRRLGRPFFIDKMPNNWLHVGLIRMILPNARIVDARRHPVGCCLSAWKQHFARGQAFSYDLTDLGRYYRDYVALMRHFDRVSPGAVHRVIYEDMVVDTEGEVRRLLDYLELPFEESCLGFWQTERAVRTASSEQVRRPIFTDAVDHWRHFEPWLQPLKDALGSTLESYRTG